MSKLVKLALGLAVLGVAIGDASAIPAFARKYQMSCSTCHAPFPRLKAFGEEFAARGFRMDDAAKEPARAVIDTGDPLLRLNRDFPVAARLDGFAAWKQDAVAETDVEWPWSAKVLSGGPISAKASYYVYAIIEKGENLKLEDAWLQFNAIWDWPVDVQVGQFQVCDPVFKRELRLEREDYRILKTRVGEAVVDLTYDRGVYLIGHAPKSIDVMLAVVNGNGIGEASAEDDFDGDNFKNVAFRVAAPVGPVRLGLLAYLGKQRGAGEFVNETTYLGPDLVANFGPKVQLNLEYLERRDDDPFFTGLPVEDVVTRGGFAELHFLPGGEDGRTAWSLLYSNVDSDDPAAVSETASLTFTWLVARNLKVVAEAGRDLEGDRTKASVGLVTAF